MKKSILYEAWCAYHSIVEWLKGITAETVFKVHITVALRFYKRKLALHKVCQNYEVNLRKG